MTQIDHDAIAAQLCLNRACKEPGPCPDLEEACLDLYDEVKRLRAERDDWMSARNDAVRERMTAEDERDALRAALEEIADGLKGIARDIQIGPDDEGREIYEMVQAIRDDARAALKGDSDE
jgi:hypothetical protein